MFLKKYWQELTKKPKHVISDNTVRDFVDTLHSQSFYFTTNKPTRITSNNATIIDNVLTNDLFIQQSGILTTDISDHLPVFILIDQSRENSLYDRVSNIRNFSANNVHKFINDLNQTDWNFVTTMENVHSIYESFLERVLRLYDKHFPVQEVKR